MQHSDRKIQFRTTHLFSLNILFSNIFLWHTASVQCLTFPKGLSQYFALLQQVQGKELGYLEERSLLFLLQSEGHIKSKRKDSSLVTSVFSKGKVIWFPLTVVTRGASQWSLKWWDKNSCHLFSNSQGGKDKFGTPYSTKRKETNLYA